MDDFYRVPFFQKSQRVRRAGKHVSVELHDDPPGANPHLLEQQGNAHSRANFFLFSVDLNYHRNKKTAPDTTT